MKTPAQDRRVANLGMMTEITPSFFQVTLTQRPGVDIVMDTDEAAHCEKGTANLRKSQY